MSGQHTPGPWRVFGATAENGTSNEIHADGEFIARVFMNGNTLKREANARLIAAAPDLLAALEKLARLGNGDQYGNSEGNMIARAAIAKVKQ